MRKNPLLKKNNMNDIDNGDNLDQKLKDIGERIDKIKASQAEKPGNSSKINGEKVFAELIAGILFGLFVGYYLDDYFETKPLFMLILIILGVAGSFYNIYKEAVKDNNKN